MASEPTTLEQELFGHDHAASPNDTHVSILLEQYKLFVGTSEALVARRQQVNTFFLSVNSIILAATSLLIREGTVNNITAPALVVLGLSGIVLCIAWGRMIRSFGQLNQGKFDVIHAIERRLPARIFIAEWAVLGRGADASKYKPFTTTESWPPWIFGLLDALVLLAGIVLLFCAT
ncbi:MAG: hypothetical protein OXU75_01485 [Deltaproteobacteria bacterium]|nr:hypothetical protein [Deltaproteobacteria bacterium]